MEDISGLRETVESVLRLVDTENKISSFLSNKFPFHLFKKKTKKNMSSTPRIHTRQCELLAKKASGVLQMLEELKSLFHRQELIEDVPIPTHDWTPGALELQRVLKDAEILIKECCCGDQWLKVAIKRGNLKDTFAKLLYDMEWHTSVLCNCAFVTRVDMRDVFDRSACEGKLGITEDFMLSSAAKQDRQSLRELIQGSHVCDRKTCKPNIAQSCLALKLGEQLDAEDQKELDMSESQPPLFLWVPSTDLEIGQLIGSGGFGTVAKATWLGQRFAIKTLASGKDWREPFMQEIAAMAGHDHPHLVRVVCCSEDDRNLSIVMELMYKSLFDVLYNSGTHAPRARTPFPIIQSVNLMLQIAEGVRCLHSRNLVHRDLKSANILLQFTDPQAIEDSLDIVPFTDTIVNPFIAKVADFGLTKRKNAMTDDHTRNVGTLAWRAPELFELADHEFREPPPRFRAMKMDAYSFGMVCYEILSGKKPFHDILPEIPVGKFHDRLIRGERPKLPAKDIPSRLAVLIQRCWEGDSRRRPDFPTICTELRYIKGLLLQGKSLASEQTTIANGPVVDFQAKIKVQGPWGGNGGRHFFDGVATSIKQMKLKYESSPHPCICYMEMEYDINGTSFAVGHGDANEGSRTALIPIAAPNEYITQIEGWTGVLPGWLYVRTSGLTSLTIRTNKKTYGPFGGEGETKFTSDNGRVIGFYGKSARVIDKIGCFIAPAEGRFMNIITKEDTSFLNQDQG